jgi:hypothetical protein
MQSLWKVDIRFFAGLSHGTIKVLRDPGAKPQQGKGAVSDPAFLETASEGRGFADVPTPSESREEQKGAEGMQVNIPCNMKSTLVGKGALFGKTWSTKEV